MINDGDSVDAVGVAKISPKHILFSEISLVTSMMRKNSRWATSTSSFTGRDLTMTAGLGLRVSGPNSAPHTYARGSPERDLMAGFQMLRRLVGDADGAWCSITNYLFL
jgi:golgi-specific brefeldin A-resistance guanine nucleotide exchange factor 1